MALAVVIPVFNEEKGLYAHITQIDRILKADGIAARFMLVDDGSRDSTWSVVRKLHAEMPNVGGIRFSRNFGKETAISAGLDAIDDEIYLVMDSDLQHPPRSVRGMLDLLEASDADIVDGVKEYRGNETLRSKLLAKGFYGILKAATGLDLDNSSDFKLLRRPVVDEIRKMTEGNRFFRSIVDYVGFKRVNFPFSVDDRDDGTSRFSTKRLLKLAFNAIVSNTAAPLYIAFLTAFLSFLGAFADAVVMIVRACMRTGVTGTQWVILTVLLAAGCILLSVGILGAYVSRVYDEVKGRARYIVSERV
ncbi:MAG: glycosyltransferase family 2 protein [Clostridiaceae bacterium]|nr:glycosyltransferase family 2 protein [Clostridiaceae bacterium]